MKQIGKFMFLVCVLVFSLTVAGCEKNNKKIDENQIYPFLRLGFQANKYSIEYKTAVKFAEKVEELSDGTVTVKIFTDGILGDDIAMIEQVMEGTLDMTYGETGRLGLWVNEAEIFGYPYAFDDFDHLKRTLASGYGQYLQQCFQDKGLLILATAYNGTRQTTSNRPINSLSDMKGLRLRVPNAYANLKFAELCGATPDKVPFNEVFLQLKADLIDGQENPLSTIDSQKYYEVQHYCALTSHIINDNNILISRESFNRLSKSQQDAVSTAAKIAAEYGTSLFLKDETDLLEKFSDYGMVITSPDKSSFRQACLPIYEEYISKYGDRAVKAIEGARK